jgi:hypothetical protein
MMSFHSARARHSSAKGKSPKAKWAHTLGVVAGLLVFTSAAASQPQPNLRLLSAPHLPAWAAVSLSGSKAQAGQESPGSVSGTILSKGGSPIAGAMVTLTHRTGLAEQQAVSDDSGTFSFVNVAPGPFALSIKAPPFATQTYSGVLATGQNYVVPPIVLVLQTITTTVVVEPPTIMAEREVKSEEHQRVLGIVPNFYVTYTPHPVPLDFAQKLDLAWKSVTDPVTVLGVAGAAGFEQGKNWFRTYGQGAQGYGRRFGATYGDVFIGTFLDSAIMPTLLKQDPRYFYKGKGSWKSRLWYALTRSIVVKGDNGHWQPNYSVFLGSLATAGIANAYRPPRDQNVGFAFKAAGARMAETALANVFEEFFSRKLTPSLSHRNKASGKDYEAVSARCLSGRVPGQIGRGSSPH